MFKAESNIGLKICQPDDIVVNTMWAWMAALGVSAYDGIVSPSYGVYRPLKNVYNPKYLNLLLRTEKYRTEYIRRSTGIHSSRLRLYPDQFLDIYFILPPRDEQDQIVRYLDWKVSQINKLVNAKRRQVGLLQEQKYITIKTAVRYADGCKKCKLKNLAFFKSGTNLTALQIKPVGDYPVYGGNGLRGYYSEFSHSGKYLLVGRQGALCGNVHYVNENFWATEHAVTVKPNSVAHIKWLYYLLIDMNLNQYSMAAAQPGLSVEYVVNLPAHFPTFEEQKAIAAYLDKQCECIDKLISKLNDEIALFAEYRTRLISDVVTGKLDVRSVTVPEYEIVEEALDDGITEDEELTETEEVR
jgi:type I restriction enzyme S subunit